MRFAVIASLLFATTLQAFPSRPVSALRSDSQLSTLWAAAVGTDGTDFLVVWVENTEKIWVQRVTPNGATTPLTMIVNGPEGARFFGLPSVVWTGSKYLVFWTKDQTHVQFCAVSREGLPLSSRPAEVLTLYQGGGLSTVTNGTTVLIAAVDHNTLFTRLLDLDGKPLAATQTLYGAPDPDEIDVLAVGGRYVIAFANGTRALLMFAGSNGSVSTEKAVVFDHPYVLDQSFISSVALASDGKDMALFFGTVNASSTPHVWSVTLDGNGQAKQAPRVIADGYSLRDAVWDGSSYVMHYLSRVTDPFDRFAATLLRVNRDGRAAGSPSVLPLEQYWAVASNGRDVFAVGREQTSSSSGQYRGWGALLPADLSAPKSSLVPLGRTFPVQHNVTVAAKGGEKLVAWIDVRGADPPAVRASRLDAEGNYLDGEGTVLGRASYEFDAWVSVDRLGDEWVVAWVDWVTSTAWVRRISRDGRLLDAAPVPAGRAFYLALRCNGDRCLIVRSFDRRLTAAVLRPGADVAEAGDLFETTVQVCCGPYLRREGLAVARDEYLVSFTVPEKTASGDYVNRLGVLRVDPDGHRKDPGPVFLSANQPWSPSVASDGRQYLVLFNDYGNGTNGIWGAQFLAGVPPNPGLPVLLAREGDTASAAFDGSRFILAWRHYAGSSLAVAPLTPFGASPVTLTPLEKSQSVDAPVVSADGTTPATIAVSHRDDVYGGVPRGGVVTLTELTSSIAPTVPSNVRITRIEGEAITVQWAPVERALAVRIELRLIDGTYRLVSVAPGGATAATVSGEGFHGTALRLRAWNSAGTSDPSADVFIEGRMRAVR